MPLPLDASMASNIDTTSSISGLLLGSASQHLLITFATDLGQHLGISGLRFCIKKNLQIVNSDDSQSVKALLSCKDQRKMQNKKPTNLVNHRRSYFSEAYIWIQHVAAIHLP